MIKRAIISVSDKTGIVPLARELSDLGIEIVSTGGTARQLNEAGIPVIPIDQVTGYPECLDGRVKTLHPRIHGGILAMRDHPDHMQTLRELEITPIDLVVINLYPFRETVQKTDATLADCIENIDIGGPGMLRAAAKNYRDVTVMTDPADYEPVLSQLRENGQTTESLRFELACKVFEHTAAYDALIAGYLAAKLPQERSPAKLTLTYDLISPLRYGENPHQKATYYQNALPEFGTLPQARQLGGKELSYNNLADTDAAISLLKEFSEPTVVAVKHANPCGVGSADDLLTAWHKAYEADSVSIFGGILACNRTVDLAVAKATKGVFLEVLVAPDFTEEGLAELQTRKNLRILHLPGCAQPPAAGRPMLKPISGGLLVQDEDQCVVNADTVTIATEKAPPPELNDDLVFAMKVVKHTKSNAIVLVRDRQTVGIGPGQPNRITSVEIAIKNAADKSQGAVMASDAFFPFPDCVEAAAAAGISAIIQPGGSIRDQESIDACNTHGIPMVMTGLRHFRH